METLVMFIVRHGVSTGYTVLYTKKVVEFLKLYPENSSILIAFLDAPSHLYKRVCPSVRPSIGP